MALGSLLDHGRRRFAVYTLSLSLTTSLAAQTEPPASVPQRVSPSGHFPEATSSKTSAE